MVAKGSVDQPGAFCAFSHFARLESLVAEIEKGVKKWKNERIAKLRRKARAKRGELSALIFAGEARLFGVVMALIGWYFNPLGVSFVQYGAFS